MKKNILAALVAVVVVVVVGIVLMDNANVRPTDPAKLAQARQRMLDRYGKSAEALHAEAIEGSDRAWHDQGNYPLAVSWLEVAVAVKPEDLESASVIGWLEWSMSEDPDRSTIDHFRHARRAVGALRRAIAANPGSAEAHYNLGQHYFVAKKYKKATKWLAKAVALGGDLQARKAYAHCLGKQGRWEEALGVWEAMDQSGPAVAHNRAKVARIVAERAASNPWRRHWAVTTLL